MAEHVRIHWLVQPSALRITMKALPGALSAHPLWWIALGEKDGRLIIMACLEIPMQPFQSRVREIDFPLLIALPDDPCLACLPINLLTILTMSPYTSGPRTPAQPFCGMCQVVFLQS